MIVKGTRQAVQKMYLDLGSRQHMAVMRGIGFRHYCRLENGTTPLTRANLISLDAIRRLAELNELRPFFEFCDKLRKEAEK